MPIQDKTLIPIKNKNLIPTKDKTLIQIKDTGRADPNLRLRMIENYI